MSKETSDVAVVEGAPAQTTAPIEDTKPAVSSQRGNLAVKSRITNELDGSKEKGFRLPQTTVAIKPVPKQRWHKKGKDNTFKAPVTIEALIDTKTNGYATGLTSEEEEYLSRTLGLDLSSALIPGRPHPFWNTNAARIKLENRTTVLYLNKGMDYIKYKVCKASALIANSLSQYEEGLYPEAEFYIHDEEEIAQKESVKVNRKRDAYVAMSKMTDVQRIEAVQILSNKSIRGLNADMINQAVGDLIEKDPAKFIRLTKMDKADVSIRAKVLECLHRNILTKSGTAISYMNEELGVNHEDTVSWFKDPKNQKMRVAIFEQLNAN